ncbi:NUDIX hydrolase [Curtobacterium ammoniigenes]|uniref:NUDIX hydrolase n=1 Tax=Curtobacterium ammoniigenes TaxID=395387 RepID=UPI00082E91D3|nr:NUDIX hydrolase [Curtobacterium ammoniigenes]
MVETVHANPWFSVTRAERDGDEWYRVIRPDSAMLIARDDAGRLLMVRGRRDTVPGVAYEFPSGTVEAGEHASGAALRETVEETGWSAVNPVLIGSFVESPGMSSSSCAVFLAELGTAGEQRLERGEDWEPVLVEPDRLDIEVLAGKVLDSGTLAALALYRSVR